MLIKGKVITLTKYIWNQHLLSTYYVIEYVC